MDVKVLMMAVMKTWADVFEFELYKAVRADGHTQFDVKQNPNGTYDIIVDGKPVLTVSAPYTRDSFEHPDQIQYRIDLTAR